MLSVLCTVLDQSGVAERSKLNCRTADERQTNRTPLELFLLQFVFSFIHWKSELRKKMKQMNYLMYIETGIYNFMLYY